jgi:MFS family permease
MAGAFPGVPFTTIVLIATLASVVSVPATIIAGMVAGSIIKYKTLLVGGMILFIAGGMAPYFTQSSLGVILAFRVLFGIGVGIVIPLGGALIIAFFEGEQRNKLMGLGAVVNNAGGILFQLLGGIAASVFWGYSFLVHGLGIITLIFVLFLPEPEKAPARQAGEAVPKMPKVFYTYAFGIFATTILFFPLLMNMSSVIEAGGMGNAAVSGMVLTMFTVGGVITGFIFPKFFGTLKQNTIPVILFIISVAMACIAFGNTIAFMYAGATFGGLGLCMMVPTIFTILGTKLHPAQVAIASGLIMGFMNAGGFVSAYAYAILAVVFNQRDNLKFPFYVAMICFAIGAIGLLLVNNILTSLNRKHQT